jgi:hypothetical protein
MHRWSRFKRSILNLALAAHVPTHVAAVLFLLQGITYFHIDATYEMRTTEYGEICISIDDHTTAERAFKRNGKRGKESKVVERQREIECVCASVDQNQ